MSETIHGRIISSSLAEFSKKKIIYGYLGIELPDGKHIRVKVDSYTWFETLKIGEKVVVEIQPLANSHILLARKIQLIDSLKGESEEATATA